MDIAGAKALKERLGHHGRADAPAASVDVSEDAHPIYRYLGVSEKPHEHPPAVPDEAPPERRRSWLLRLLGQG
jgi:hypothetical protein